MRTFRALALFLSLLAFWQALSARIDPLFITLGVVFSIAVTAFSLRLLDVVVGPAHERPPLNLLQTAWYLLWLLTRIPPAGLVVARVVLDPRRPPRPGVVRFRTGLQSPAARTVLANSITLVPGTMTLNVVGDEFTVHAFTPDSVGDLANAQTQARIARAFRVPPDDPPVMIWDPIHDELPEEALANDALRRQELTRRHPGGPLPSEDAGVRPDEDVAEAPDEGRPLGAGSDEAPDEGRASGAGPDQAPDDGASPDDGRAPVDDRAPDDDRAPANDRAPDDPNDDPAAGGPR